MIARRGKYSCCWRSSGEEMVLRKDEEKLERREIWDIYESTRECACQITTALYFLAGDPG